jgi:hypothetical protein
VNPGLRLGDYRPKFVATWAEQEPPSGARIGLRAKFLNRQQTIAVSNQGVV